jgi:hypothetical protein
MEHGSLNKNNPENSTKINYNYNKFGHKKNIMKALIK